MSRCKISKNTMYRMVPVATALKRMMTGESLPDILDSVTMTMMIPSGDMDEKMAMSEAVIPIL